MKKIFLKDKLKNLKRQSVCMYVCMYACISVLLIFILCNGIYADEVKNKINDKTVTGSTLNLNDDLFDNNDAETMTARL